MSIFDKLKDTDSLKPWLVENNTAYNKTITVIDIESATTDGGSTTLKGNNFYQAMKLTVGESEVAYRFVSENEIVVESALASGDTVMAKLYDSEGKQIAESNAYVLP